MAAHAHTVGEETKYPYTSLNDRESQYPCNQKATHVPTSKSELLRGSSAKLKEHGSPPTKEWLCSLHDGMSIHPLEACSILMRAT